MARLLLVCLGGAIGTGLRYGVGWFAIRWLGTDFPFGTLIVNLVGSFAIGVVQEFTLRGLLTEDARLFLSVGVMGGLTTYSSFSYETVRLMQAEAWPRAWLNVVGTTTFCLALCMLGIAATRALLPPR